MSSAAMANPARDRNRAAILVTTAVIAILVGAALPDTDKGFTPRFLFLMGGLVGITFGGVLLLICWHIAKRYARLKAGQGIIARWTIEPFTGNNSASKARRGARAKVSAATAPISHDLRTVGGTLIFA